MIKCSAFSSTASFASLRSCTSSICPIVTVSFDFYLSNCNSTTCCALFTFGKTCLCTSGRLSFKSFFIMTLCIYSIVYIRVVARACVCCISCFCTCGRSNNRCVRMFVYNVIFTVLGRVISLCQFIFIICAIICMISGVEVLKWTAVNYDSTKFFSLVYVEEISVTVVKFFSREGTIFNNNFTCSGCIDTSTTTRYECTIFDSNNSAISSGNYASAFSYLTALHCTVTGYEYSRSCTMLICMCPENINNFVFIFPVSSNCVTVEVNCYVKSTNKVNIACKVDVSFKNYTVACIENCFKISLVCNFNRCSCFDLVTVHYVRIIVLTSVNKLELACYHTVSYCVIVIKSFTYSITASSASLGSCASSICPIVTESFAYSITASVTSLGFCTSSVFPIMTVSFTIGSAASVTSLGICASSICPIMTVSFAYSITASVTSLGFCTSSVFPIMTVSFTIGSAASSASFRLCACCIAPFMIKSREDSSFDCTTYTLIIYVTICCTCGIFFTSFFGICMTVDIGFCSTFCTCVPMFVFAFAPIIGPGVVNSWNNLLSLENFVTNRTVRTFCKTCFCTSWSFSIINHYSMSSCSNNIRLNENFTASVAFHTLCSAVFCTSWCFCRNFYLI